MFNSLKKSLDNSPYLSFKTVSIGLSIIVVLTGLAVSLGLTQISQDLRQQAFEEDYITPPPKRVINPCSWCGRSCGFSSKQGTNCPDVMPPEGCECVYDRDKNECVNTCEVEPGVTSAPEEPSQKELCETDGGTWQQFPNACADTCSYAANPKGTMCAQVITMSCNCGPSECWDGDSCEPNPSPAPTTAPAPTKTPQPSPTPAPTVAPDPTLTYTIESGQPSVLKIIRQPFTRNSGDSLTVIVTNQRGYQFEATRSQECDSQGCFYEFYPVTNTKATKCWYTRKPTEEVEKFGEQSEIGELEGAADRYDQSWIVKTDPCPGLDADFNQDCLVNATDRSFLINRIWGNTADDLKADIAGPQGRPDGVVNIWDYSKLVWQWTETN